jgi:hypothetical protein
LLHDPIYFCCFNIPAADCTLALDTEILAKTLPTSAFETSKLPSAAAKVASASSILIHNHCCQSNNVSPFTKVIVFIYLTYITRNSWNNRIHVFLI